MRSASQSPNYSRSIKTMSSFKTIVTGIFYYAFVWIAGILLGSVFISIAAFIIGIVARCVEYGFNCGWNILQLGAIF